MTVNETTYYNLKYYKEVEGAPETFLSYRLNVSGADTTSQNLYILDTALHAHDVLISALQTRKQVYPFEVIRDSITGYYEANISELGTSYIENTIIMVKADSTSEGSVYLNLENYSSLPIKPVYRINLSGVAVQLGAGEFIANKWYLLIYDSSHPGWVYLGTTSQDIRISGTSANFVKIGSDNSIQDSSYSASNFAPSANGVNNGNSHNHAPGGGGGTIDYTSISNTPTLPSTVSPTANFYINSYNSTNGSFGTGRPTWAEIDKTTSSIADITTKNHGLLSDVGNNTHPQIDAHIANVTNPHSTTASQVGAIATNLVTTKGDLIVANATGSPSRIAVGSTNGLFLSVNSSATSGIEWKNPSIPRITSSGYSSPLVVNIDTTDLQIMTDISGTLTIGSPTGTVYSGQKFLLRLKDDGIARTLSWNAVFRGIGITLPTTTYASKLMYFGFIYNVNDLKWDCIAYVKES